MIKSNIIKEYRGAQEWLIKELTMFNVNENGIIVSRIDDKPFIFNASNSSDEGYKISLFTDYLNEKEDIKTIILNLVNETLDKGSIDKLWFHDNIVYGLIYKFDRMINKMVHFDDNDSENASPDALQFVGKFKDKIPKSFLQNYNKIKGTNYMEFMNVFVNRKKEAVFRTNLFEENALDNIKVTKSVVSSLRELLEEIFDVSKKETKKKTTWDLSHYVSSSNNLKCPSVDATLRTFVKIYKRLNKYLEMTVPDEVVDTDKLQEIIDNLASYSDATRWLVQTSSLEKSVAKTSVPVEHQSVSINPVTNQPTTVNPTTEPKVVQDNSNWRPAVLSEPAPIQNHNPVLTQNVNPVLVQNHNPVLSNNHIPQVVNDQYSNTPGFSRIGSGNPVLNPINRSRF